MQTVSINPTLLQTQVRDLVLRPGMTLIGLVTERHNDHGILLLAGVPVVAELPPEIEAGARLRLRVTETGMAKATMAIMGDVTGPESGPAAQTAPVPASALAPAPAPLLIGLPGGVHVHLQVVPDEDGADRGSRPVARAVTLQLDSPELGRMTLRLDRAACAVHVADGEPFALARGAAGELTAALARATGHPVAVTVHPVRGSVDLRA